MVLYLSKRKNSDVPWKLNSVMPRILFIFICGLIQKTKGFWLFLVFLLLAFNYSYGYDSLKLALSLHQSSQFKKALPIFIDLAEKFRNNRNTSDYALCQLKIADIIRNYGGVNTAIELLTTNEKLMEIGLERPTLTLATITLLKLRHCTPHRGLQNLKEPF